MKAKEVVEDVWLGIIDGGERHNLMQLLPEHYCWLKKSVSVKEGQD